MPKNPALQGFIPSAPPHRATTAIKIALAIVLLYAAVVRLTLLDRPFQRDGEGVSSFFGILARDYFRYDWRTTLGVPVQSMMASPRQPVFYGNHPPLVPWLVALTYAAFGYRGVGLPPDWQMRVPAALFTLGCICLIFKMLLTRAGPRAAILAAAIFASVPITVMYGGHEDVVNPQLVFFALLTISAYERLCDTPSGKWLALTILAFIPAGMTDWVAFYLLPVLTVHWMVTHPWRRWGWIIALGAVGTMLFAAEFLQVSLVRHTFGWMSELVARRSVSGQSDSGHRFTTWEWIRVALLEWNIRKHTVEVLLLALAWVCVDGWRVRDNVPAGRLTRLLLAWAALHVLVGRQGVYNHDWWWWPETPGVTIAAALLLDNICRSVESRGISRKWTSATLAVALLVFAAFNTWQVMYALLSPRLYNKEMPYSIADYGRAIHAAAPPFKAVIVIDNEPTISLWYYGDRPIIYALSDDNLWTLDGILARIAKPAYTDLPFLYVDKNWTDPPVAIVMPMMYARTNPFLEKLAAQLDARFAPLAAPPDLGGEFRFWDATKPIIEPAQK